MINDPKSPAYLAKLRTTNGERKSKHSSLAALQPAAEEDGDVAASPAARVVTGGKAMKTGMVLARAKLPAAVSGISATRDRQNTMLSKGVYRDA